MKPKLIKALIKAKRQLSPDSFSIELQAPGLTLRPGNFFQLRTSDTLDPYLNRPISVAGYKKSRLLLIVREVGRGTALLRQRRIGDRLLMLGPLGQGIVPEKKKTLLVAGGIGIAPLYFLAQTLARKNVSFSLIYGVKNKGDHILTAELKRVSSDLKLVHEYGPGRKMTALDALKNTRLSDYDIVYACGPKAMLMELQKMETGLPTHVFCEDFLGCGCGICLGCAIKIKDKYKRVCADGPVFELGEIRF